jgi:hypothetical protein
MHNTQQTQERTIMPSAGLEAAIPAIKRLQTYALDRTATGISECILLRVTTDEQFHFPLILL